MCYLLSIEKKKTTNPTNCTLNDHTLERLLEAKYLGVHITENLHRGTHVKYIVVKANKAWAFAHRNLKVCYSRIQPYCCKCLARPILDYAATMWDLHQQDLISTLEITQRRAARRTLQDDILKTATTVPQSVRQRHPDVHDHKWSRAHVHTVRSYQVSLSTRGHQLKLPVPHARTGVHKYYFIPSAIKLWNTLNQASITAPPPVTAFK